MQPNEQRSLTLSVEMNPAVAVGARTALMSYRALTRLKRVRAPTPTSPVQVFRQTTCRP
jgi:hypothetical protein